MDRKALPPKAVLDVQGALKRFGGDEELFADMIGFLVEDAPPLVTDLQAAIEAQDVAAAQRAAHAVKGLILGCGGVRAGQVAQRVEDAASRCDLDEVGVLAPILVAEVDQLLGRTMGRTMGTPNFDGQNGADNGDTQFR